MNLRKKGQMTLDESAWVALGWANQYAWLGDDNETCLKYSCFIHLPVAWAILYSVQSYTISVMFSAHWFQGSVICVNCKLYPLHVKPVIFFTVLSCAGSTSTILKTTSIDSWMKHVNIFLMLVSWSGLWRLVPEYHIVSIGQHAWIGLKRWLKQFLQLACRTVASKLGMWKQVMPQLL